jgi:hypothetical protein
MPNPTGNSQHDNNVLASELTYQNTMATVTTHAAAKTADIARLSAIVASGQANGISVVNQMTALKSLNPTGAA